MIDVTATVVRTCLWLLCSVSLVTYTGAGGEVYQLPVLHTNDMHSRFDQIDRVGGRCVRDTIGGGSQVRDCYGGFARLKTAVDTARNEAAGTVDGTLFLNAGDTFQGTTFYSYLKWPAVAWMIRSLGIDAMVCICFWSCFYLTTPQNFSLRGKATLCIYLAIFFFYHYYFK